MSNKKIEFYELFMYYQSGELIYFEDFFNKETVDIPARMDVDKDFIHRM